MSKCFKYVVIPSDETLPLEERYLSIKTDESEEDAIERVVVGNFGSENPIKVTLLLRPTINRDPGLYTYSLSRSPKQNIRATRLSMGCGILSSRLSGDVLVFRHFSTDLNVDNIFLAACGSPDLREELLAELGIDTSGGIMLWLANASQQNYHDQTALRSFAKAMEGDVDSDVGSDVGRSSDSDDDDDDDEDRDEQDTSSTFVTQVPLCLVCRGPSSNLCQGCKGAYFCDLPRLCRKTGWSHECLCSTWAVYCSRRELLSTFPLGDWYKGLVDRENELSEEPCRYFLTHTLGISLDESSWWTTEIGGWAGGESGSAKTVDLSSRTGYQQGFWPVVDYPPERRLLPEEVDKAGVQANEFGFWNLKSWRDYYELRGICLSSPVALLLTFPMTIYYSIARYGEVPVTVARMLNRSLRLHIVGAEKEINFIDMFKEVSFLAPSDVKFELVFIIREDMLPPQCNKSLRVDGDTQYVFREEISSNLSVFIVPGTYGESLDPNFDCGCGTPDMVIGLNAGLFAYESWRSVIDYLDRTPSVVGVFTDYNEHSGMNCASLGGGKVRNSLSVNPFRQPRAMPVYSMNLPQFSNGFLYVFNQQEID